MKNALYLGLGIGLIIFAYSGVGETLNSELANIVYGINNGFFAFFPDEVRTILRFMMVSLLIFGGYRIYKKIFYISKD